MNSEVVAPASSHNLNYSRVLAIIGAALISSAYFAVLVNGWPTLSATLRVTLVAVPNTALLLLYLLRRQTDWQEVANNSFLLGLLILPSTVATALFQFQVISEISGDLMLTSTLICLPFVISADYRLKQIKTAHLLIINLVFIGLLTMAKLNWSTLVEAFLATGIAVIILLLAVTAQVSHINRYYQGGQLYATAILLLALPMLIQQLFYTSTGLDMNTGGPTGLGLIQGVMFWLVGVAYVRFFQPLTYREVTYQRFWLVVGALSIIFSSSFSNTTVEQVTALLASISIIILGLIFSVNLVFLVGVFGLMVSALSLVSYFAGNVSLPIIMFAGGLVLIGFSILVNRGQLASTSRTMALPALNQLGVVSDSTARSLSHPANHLSWASWVKIIAVGFFGVILLSILFTLLLAGVQ